MYFFIPLLVLVIFLKLTNNMIVSLLIGIITANTIANQFFNHYNIFELLTATLQSLFKTIVTPAYFYSLTFLFLLTLTINILIELDIVSSYQDLIKKHIDTKKKFLFSIVSSSWLFFIDDYLITLSLKNFFGSLLETYKVKKETFSYLISSNAPCICTIVPITSWTAIILIPIYQIISIKNLNNSAYEILLDSIKYFIYPISSIVNSWISIGTETIDNNKEKLIFQKNNNQKIHHKNIFLFVLPFIVMFGFIIFTIINFQINNPDLKLSNIIDSINISRTMSVGISFGTFFLLLICYIFRAMKINIISKNIIFTVREMFIPLTVLIFVWSFSGLIGTITDISFLYDSPLLNQYSSLLPAIIMIIITVLSALTGSSWGAICLSTPFLSFASTYEELAIYLGASVSGALLGSHLSLISDAITVSATAANVAIINSYKNQFWFTISAGISSLVIFLLVSYNNFKFVSFHYYAGYLLSIVIINYIFNIIIHSVKNKLMCS